VFLGIVDKEMVMVFLSGLIPYVVGCVAFMAPFIILSAFFTLVTDIRDINRIDRQIRKERERKEKEYGRQ
jgi:hypothetical protein